MLPYNDSAKFAEFCSNNGAKTAAVIVEPVAGNMGLIPGTDEFLATLRDECTKQGILLIFDEVISGFRLAPGAYSGICRITPDLTCLGKIIGGGMPVGALAGPSEIMDCLSPGGPVYQAGTLSGNPVALAAGIATIRYLKEKDPYDELSKLAKKTVAGIQDICRKNSIKAAVSRKGGMFTVFFGLEDEPHDMEEAMKLDAGAFEKAHVYLRRNGFYLSPAPYEVNFISTEHTEENIDAFIAAFAGWVNDNP